MGRSAFDGCKDILAAADKRWENIQADLPKKIEEFESRKAAS